MPDTRFNFNPLELLNEGEQCDTEQKTFSFPHFWMTLKNTIRFAQPSSGLQDIALVEFGAESPNDSTSNADVSFAHEELVILTYTLKR